MREGLRFVWGWPGLTIVLAMAALLNFFGVPCLSFIPLLVTTRFEMGALELGWLQTVSGIGLLSGGLLLSTWGGFRSRVATMFAALALHHFGGRKAKTWIEGVNRRLMQKQLRDVPAAGSWAAASRFSSHGGPLYETAFSLLTLQVADERLSVFKPAGRIEEP